MKRRDFVNWVGLGLLASSLPVAIAACRSSEPASTTDGGPTAPATADSTPRPDGFTEIGTVSELDANGALTASNLQGQRVAVIRNPVSQDGVFAVNSICTHQGCTVDWDGSADLFVCPCHGSKFSPDGSVVEGPATDPLPTFEAKIEGDQVFVNVS